MKRGNAIPRYPVSVCQRQIGDTAVTKSLKSILISKNYLLTYPDGSKKHVSRAERDDLLLSGLAKQTAPQRYLFIGQQHTLHSFAELSTLNIASEPSNLRRFLPGCFIIELDGKRRRELLETPEACAFRMQSSSAVGEFQSAGPGSSEATN